ncbi:hypothetical protein D9757_005266 [Collybiopsis confluens]|uniref:Eisosome component PIL1-domain-containing protein n=1 Tax=Collybiopsis confluens TaxID=2823264 RepID=A0A8H5HW18_9AGAR|nr:hypothetical protein D9757_005266 [Collybiopsis confluens]
MFKTAATKIAHNSTIPSLAGNKDLRPLQDLITAEKAVLVASQKLSLEFGKAAEALRIWGSGEGEDLLDTLSASTNLLNQFAGSLANYASHEHAIRDHMKSIRASEESLDELKRKRKALISKADAAERKLSKMSPEHKNLHLQTDTLNRLRDEIRVMDSDIMSDEASLSDMKRSKTKAWMGLKFGGLLECCEKGTIIGEFGRLVIAEIPEETTQPGMARTMYMNHGKVNSLLSDASRCVSEVSFSTVPPPGTAPPAPKNDFLGSQQGINTGHFLDASEVTSNTCFNNTYSFLPEPSYSSSPLQPYPPASRSTEEFGGGSPTSPVGSRFATFPVSTNTSTAGYSTHDDASLTVGPNFSGAGEDSFSSSVAAALDMRKSIEEPAPSYETHQAHLPGPPSGAAPPLIMSSPWETNDNSRISASGEDVGLAYMNPSQEDLSTVGRSRPTSREVHFGQVSDIDTEMNKRQEQEDIAAGGISSGGGGGTGARVSPRRIPPPSVNPDEEERALNAAAAMRIGKELESFGISSSAMPTAPAPAPASPSLEISQDSGRDLDRSSSFGSTNTNRRSASPLIPPVAPFAQRGRSPGPIDNGDTISPSRQSPPRISLPDRQISSTSSGSFRTPPEYPRSGGASPFAGRSSSSLVGSVPSSPVVSGAPRTISAAAFRRPAANNRSASNDFGGSGPNLSASGVGGVSGGAGTGLRSSSSPLADVSPLHPRKRGASGTGFSSLSQSNTTPEIPHTEPLNRFSQAGSEDQYDYINAYTDVPTPAHGASSVPVPAPARNSYNYQPPPPLGSGSPQTSDFGSLGQMRVANDVGGYPPSPGSPQGDWQGQGQGQGYGQHQYGGPGGHPSTTGRPGYGEGRFATDLESEFR